MTDGERELDPTCELFRTGDPEFRDISPLSRWWMPVCGAIIGAGGGLVRNTVARIPWRAGVQRHALFGALGFVFGEWAHQFSVRMAAEKDFQYYHYMTLHPDDFAPPKKIKFRDFLEPWHPIR